MKISLEEKLLNRLSEVIDDYKKDLEIEENKINEQRKIEEEKESIRKVVIWFNELLGWKYDELGLDYEPKFTSKENKILFNNVILYHGSEFSMHKDAYIDGTKDVSYDNLTNHIILLYNQYINNELEEKFYPKKEKVKLKRFIPHQESGNAQRIFLPKSRPIGKKNISSLLPKMIDLVPFMTEDEVKIFKKYIEGVTSIIDKNSTTLLSVFEDMLHVLNFKIKNRIKRSQ